MNKTSLGITENLAGALCYILGFISGIIFLVIEKDNPYVKFHAIQSILISAIYFVLSIIFGFIPIVGWVLLLALPIVSMVVWIICMVKAGTGNMFKLPFIGDIAEQQL